MTLYSSLSGTIFIIVSARMARAMVDMALPNRVSIPLNFEIVAAFLFAIWVPGIVLQNFRSRNNFLRALPNEHFALRAIEMSQKVGAQDCLKVDL